jgi:hypothetical protein
MNRIRTLLTVTALVLISAAVSAQDVRTLGTKVADLLAGCRLTTSSWLRA